MAGLGTSDGKGAGGPSPFYTEARARTRRISSRPAENDCLIRNAVLSIKSACVHICTSFPLYMFHQTPLSSERRRPEPSVYHVRMDLNQHIGTLFICRLYLSCRYNLVHLPHNQSPIIRQAKSFSRQSRHPLAPPFPSASALRPNYTLLP